MHSQHAMRACLQHRRQSGPARARSPGARTRVCRPPPAAVLCTAPHPSTTLQLSSVTFLNLVLLYAISWILILGRFCSHANKHIACTLQMLSCMAIQRILAEFFCHDMPLWRAALMLMASTSGRLLARFRHVYAYLAAQCLVSFALQPCNISLQTCRFMQKKCCSHAVKFSAKHKGCFVAGNLLWHAKKLHMSFK